MLQPRSGAPKLCSDVCYDMSSGIRVLQGEKPLSHRCCTDPQGSPARKPQPAGSGRPRQLPGLILCFVWKRYGIGKISGGLDDTSILKLSLLGLLCWTRFSRLCSGQLSTTLSGDQLLVMDRFIRSRIYITSMSSSSSSGLSCASDIVMFFCRTFDMEQAYSCTEGKGPRLKLGV